MALRRQVAEARSTYRDPVFGVNLQKAEQDLREGDARLLENIVLDGGVRMRTGNQRTTTASLGAFRIRGGTKFYYGGNLLLSRRIIAYSTNISQIADNGTETVLLNSMTTDRDTHFFAWPITDELYIANGIDTLVRYDGTAAPLAQTGTAIPVPIFGGLQPILDRVMCITGNGIERSDPRVTNVWSTNSSWATLRPLHAGVFTALKSFALRGTDSIFDGIIALQASAHYLVTGTDFGSDVTAATASSGENARIQLLNPNVGTRSPYSPTVVPGLGMFWFTNDLNVYYLPEQTISQGRFVGDSIRSTGTTTGIESTNLAALGQVWMEYLHPYLMLGVPTGSDVFPRTQWWMDVRSLVNNPERGPVWYGPMTGQTVGRMWAETQINDNSVYCGEGNSATGAFVYRARVANIFADAIGTTDTNFEGIWQTNFKDMGAPSRQKYVRGVHMDMNAFSGDATIDLVDLDGDIETGIAVLAI